MSLPQNSTLSSVPSISPSSCKRRKRMQITNVKLITELPDELLLKILMTMSTEEAVRTSLISKRWEGVWKKLPHLSFDMRKTVTSKEYLIDRSDYIAQLITKVIRNHGGHMECCKIQHFSYQIRDGMLETWIQLLTRVKHTKCLELRNLRSRRTGSSVAWLSPNIFSHPDLTSLLLFRYDLESALAFDNCHNLSILRLEKICAEAAVFNTVIKSCPFLKVLVLDITWYTRTGGLKIHHDNLKLLHLACTDIDYIEVSAALLDIFSVNYVFVRECYVRLSIPRMLQFNKNDWLAEANMPHISYNISCGDQGEENIAHEFVVSRKNYNLRRFTSLTVSVDVMDPKEVHMLKEFLDVWGREVRKLEIFFKDNNVLKEEGESSVDVAQGKKWERFYLNADFIVKDVWMYNFSGLNEEEFVLASRFVTQGTMIKKLMIKTSPTNENNWLGIQTAVAKLMELPKGNKELNIVFF
ncbi:unnamed protein product [Thlaspi arvense]|uniref:F-box domain-containing protein n=1 Tax=Thlaspi arvense TaxID=13288 RepID=A0AAU9RIL2_THLAR|nr:unnamed protein product [Thlaspi arvense]